MTAEKKKMLDEANNTITLIRQMEASLESNHSHSKSQRGRRSDDDLRITFPLTRCLVVLKEKHGQISRLHRERWEQVKSTLPSCSRPDRQVLTPALQNLFRLSSPTLPIWNTALSGSSSHPQGLISPSRRPSTSLLPLWRS